MFKNLEAFASGFLRIKFGIVEALKVLSESLRNPMSECLRNMVRILKKFQRKYDAIHDSQEPLPCDGFSAHVR